MRRFILLHQATNPDPKPVWVNVDHIMSMEPVPNAGLTRINTELATFRVTEDISAIFDAIRNAERSEQ